MGIPQYETRPTILEFGDGIEVELFLFKETIDNDGVKITLFNFRPTEELEKHYPQQIPEREQDGSVWWWIESIELTDLNKDANARKIFCRRKFDKTPGPEYEDFGHSSEQNKNLQKQIKLLELERDGYREELKRRVNEDFFSEENLDKMENRWRKLLFEVIGPKK
jgi:hypothetical protein